MVHFVPTLYLGKRDAKSKLVGPSVTYEIYFRPPSFAARLRYVELPAGQIIPARSELFLVAVLPSDLWGKYIIL